MSSLKGKIGSLLRKKEKDDSQKATVVFMESAEDAAPVKKVSQGVSKVEVEKVKRIKKNRGRSSDKIPGDDSVVSDMSKFRRFAGKFFGKIKNVVSLPTTGAVKSVSDSMHGFRFTIGSAINAKLIKGIVTVTIIVILIGAVAYLAPKGLRIIQNHEEDNLQIAATPTPVAYQPYKPSVYADDPEMLKLQEDINVLKRELSNVNIRETSLNPPNLDFSVRF